jgi:hypothetical protein
MAWIVSLNYSYAQISRINNSELLHIIDGIAIIRGYGSLVVRSCGGMKTCIYSLVPFLYSVKKGAL